MLTAERLREVLNYDPETGVWVWRLRRGPRVLEGSVAGGVSRYGYRQIGVDGRRYEAHRMAFLYMLGRWPAQHVDHRDLDRSNGAWNNLREATRSQNAMNKVMAKRNKSGLKGVSWSKIGKSWVAMIGKDGKQNYLGYYDCKAAAHFAYIVAADKLHGEFARSS